MKYKIYGAKKMRMRIKLAPYISKKCLSIIFKGRPDEPELGSVCLLVSM
jgi:hypothetical protein